MKRGPSAKLMCRWQGKLHCSSTCNHHFGFLITIFAICWFPYCNYFFNTPTLETPSQPNSITIPNEESLRIYTTTECICWAPHIDAMGNVHLLGWFSGAIAVLSSLTGPFCFRRSLRLKLKMSLSFAHFCTTWSVYKNHSNYMWV